MKNTSKFVKYSLAAAGLLLLLTLLLPVCKYNILGYDLLSFTGIELLFGKTVKILGESIKLGGSMAGMMIFFPAIGMAALSAMTEETDDESRGVFAIFFSVIHLGLMVYLTKSMESIGMTYQFGFWLNVIIAVMAFLLGVYSLYLQKVRNGQ